MTTATPAPYYTENFTELEAKSKIGKTVRLLADYNNLSKETVGYIVDFHEITKGSFDIVVRWELSKCQFPIYERFNRSKYNQILAEVGTTSSMPF